MGFRRGIDRLPGAPDAPGAADGADGPAERMPLDSGLGQTGRGRQQRCSRRTASVAEGSPAAESRPVLAFGLAWADTDQDGCSQRVNALAQRVDRSQPFIEVRRGRCRHDVIAGTWVDPYTGQAMTFTNIKDQQQAQQIPVDHR